MGTSHACGIHNMHTGTHKILKPVLKKKGKHTATYYEKMLIIPPARDNLIFFFLNWGTQIWLRLNTGSLLNLSPLDLRFISQLSSSFCLKFESKTRLLVLWLTHEQITVLLSLHNYMSIITINLFSYAISVSQENTDCDIFPLVPAALCWLWHLFWWVLREGAVWDSLLNNDHDILVTIHLSL